MGGQKTNSSDDRMGNNPFGGDSKKRFSESGRTKFEDHWNQESSTRGNVVSEDIIKQGQHCQVPDNSMLSAGINKS